MADHRQTADHALGLASARAFIRMAGMLRAGGTISDDEYEALRAAFTADLDVWSATASPTSGVAQRVEELRQLLDDSWARNGPR